MRETPCILVVDDQPANRDIFQTRLTVSGYQVILAGDGEEALRVAREQLPDLVLLDVMMPKISGIDVCRELKGDPSLPYIPIIMVTAKADSKDVVVGLEAGAEEYLTKPVDQAALVARVKSMLRIKDLHDKVQEQAARLESQSQELAGWNRTLEERVQKQLAELERAGRLKRFFSPQLAEALLSSGAEEFLQSHRQEITVVFCDLRGFTAFSETVAPEELMEVLRTYHGAMGTLISRFEGTLERFTGDGLMVFFNDPQPVPDHGERAVRMALAMRAEMEGLSEAWRKQGHQLDFGVGIARGYATLGMIGFEGRVDYGAIGPVTNLAARLCEQAQGG
ncbi:MAG: response regulator, partial [SAR324 cluster bacterium]|nr:response regulator [SAR324 cluster bacterium]